MNYLIYDMQAEPSLQPVMDMETAQKIKGFRRWSDTWAHKASGLMNSELQVTAMSQSDDEERHIFNIYIIY